MIVLIVVAILAIIAYNVYTSYVRRAQRSNARVQLLQTAQHMERYYSAHNIYPNLKTYTYKNWQISKKPNNSSQTYTLKAKKLGGITDKKCGTMKLKNNGKKIPPTQKCWPSE